MPQVSLRFQTCASWTWVRSAGGISVLKKLPIAILLGEFASKLPEPPGIQIFASDISEDAIRHARDCRYDETIVADVSPEHRDAEVLKDRPS